MILLFIFGFIRDKVIERGFMFLKKKLQKLNERVEYKMFLQDVQILNGRYIPYNESTTVQFTIFNKMDSSITLSDFAVNDGNITYRHDLSPIERGYHGSVILYLDKWGKKYLVKHDLGNVIIPDGEVNILPQQKAEIALFIPSEVHPQKVVFYVHHLQKTVMIDVPFSVEPDSY